MSNNKRAPAKPKTKKKPEKFDHDIKFSRSVAGKALWESMNCAVLELFKFARVIIDEYTYPASWIFTILRHLKAYSYFLLSGTPTTDKHSNVKRLADLHIHLGREDYSGLTPEIFEKKTRDMTSEFPVLLSCSMLTK